MALNTIWVYAEAVDGKVSPLTLELLTKARSLGSTVEAVYAGADADAVAGALGAHGSTKVHSTGDLGGSLDEPGARAPRQELGVMLDAVDELEHSLGRMRHEHGLGDGGHGGDR